MLVWEFFRKRTPKQFRLKIVQKVLTSKIWFWISNSNSLLNSFSLSEEFSSGTVLLIELHIAPAELYYLLAAVELSLFIGWPIITSYM